MKKLILITAIMFSSLLMRAQHIEEDCIDDYKPCTECFESGDNWKTDINNPSVNNKKAKNNMLTNINGSNSNSLVNQAKTGLSRTAKTLIGIGLAAVAAIVVIKLNKTTNAISFQ